LKRSRIICSIITVVYIILSIALTLLLIKSSMLLKSIVSVYLKAIYISILGMSILMYIGVRRRLGHKMSNKTWSVKISQVYCYLYLAVTVLISRIVAVYMLKDGALSEIIPSFSNGLCSYLNYGLGKVINNQMYANVILNTILVFISSVIIKRVMLNITDSDIVSTATSIIYILLPTSLVNVIEYARYNYNLVLVLSGIYLLLHIIDKVKTFNKKSNKYLIYAIVLGLVQLIDIIIGGTYAFWLGVLLIATLAAMYIDSVHIRVRFNSSTSFKIKRIIEKIEKINISKLLLVCLISLGISGIGTVIYSVFSNANNYQMFSLENLTGILNNARSYYLALIICSFVFEIIGILLQRKLDIKMFIIKVAYISLGVITFFMVNNTSSEVLFETFLILNVIINICNICYNREEKIKLLNEKN